MLVFPAGSASSHVSCSGGRPPASTRNRTAVAAPTAASHGWLVVLLTTGVGHRFGIIARLLLRSACDDCLCRVVPASLPLVRCSKFAPRDHRVQIEGDKRSKIFSPRAEQAGSYAWVVDYFTSGRTLEPRVRVLPSRLEVFACFQTVKC
jgi:hypothetical protein